MKCATFNVMAFSAITCPGFKKKTVPETKNMTRIAHNICLHKDFSIVLFIFIPPLENSFLVSFSHACIHEMFVASFLGTVPFRFQIH
jgi:hypothetical protein